MPNQNKRIEVFRKLRHLSSFQWLLSILAISIVSFGLWSSVFANDSQSIENNAFIPIEIHASKEADYSRDVTHFKIMAISPSIVEDILFDEEIIQNDLILERIEQFFEKLLFPIPSVIPITNSLQINTEHQFIASVIDENQPTEDQLDDNIQVVVVEGFVDRAWPILTMPYEASPPPDEGAGGDDTSGTNGDSEADDQEDSGGDDFGKDDSDGDDSSGGNKNDDKDDNPDDGDAGKGNDDKDDKDKGNDNKDDNSDDGDAGKGNDDKDDNSDDGDAGKGNDDKENKGKNK